MWSGSRLSSTKELMFLYLILDTGGLMTKLPKGLLSRRKQCFHYFPLHLLLVTIVIGGVNSEYIEYNTAPRIVPEKIRVHLVPHSHDDVGWLKTVDQYYVGANNSIWGACVENVIESVIASLLDDQNRKFIYVEMAFFQRWWRQQSNAKKVKVKKLVDSGQLEFINGGMCMHDEATPHYIDMIDQTTLGHQFIKRDKNFIWTKWSKNNLSPPKLFYVDQICVNDVFAINDGSI
ncbi:hypothetical protein F2Q68_00014272 [Brassica cretica]|uniref:Glycoside hydrolase family 38 N-terminal domain-containing protein n=1 Tax=Brassica cretica TaxID=69181 RepID=A0A8S9HU91_BRACR|nr:hypothetical protein F2Q68_00014272 [Brassica cretica]